MLRWFGNILKCLYYNTQHIDRNKAAILSNRRDKTNIISGEVVNEDNVGGGSVYNCFVNNTYKTFRITQEKLRFHLKFVYDVCDVEDQTDSFYFIEHYRNPQYTLSD